MASVSEEVSARISVDSTAGDGIGPLAATDDFAGTHAEGAEARGGLATRKSSDATARRRRATFKEEPKDDGASSRAHSLYAGSRAHSVSL